MQELKKSPEATPSVVDYGTMVDGTGKATVYEVTRWTDRRVTLRHVAVFDDLVVAEKFCSTWRGR